MDVPSLTQAEASERGALITVGGYEIFVDLTGLIDGPQVRCTSTIRFTSGERGARTFVDCAARVLSARLNGRPVPAGAVTPGRIELAALAEENVLVVESVQDDTTAGSGVHKVVDPVDGEIYVWMSFEPDECRFAWACFDQPDLKATHTFTVVAPPTWTVLSNTGEVSVDAPGPVTTWSFAATPRLSTYNLVILGGPLAEIHAERGGYDLALYARSALRPVLERDAEEVFTVTAQGLAFFGDRFAMPFPQRRYAQAFMPDFGGAMENYGCVTWSDTFLYRNEPTQLERTGRARILLHEMAHMWLGNIVTMRWWDDLWLNESFAEFAARWAGVAATKFHDMWTDHLIGGKLQAYLADQGPTSHPIRQHVPDVAAAAGTFDAITYPKGTSVLRQLTEYIGEDAFVTGMRSYFARHAWANTTVDDLTTELATASGQDLNGWSRGWLATAGPDRFTLQRSAGADVLIAEGPSGTPPRPHTLCIGAYRRHGDRLERTALTRVTIDGRHTDVPGLNGADLILVNDEDLTFATVTPDAASAAALFTNARRLPTPLARAVAAATMWNLLTTGHATTADIVTALTDVIRVETAESILEPLLNLTVGAAEWWSPDSIRDRLLIELADACLELTDQPQHRVVAARGLARTATTPTHFRALDTAADTPDLRWRTLARRAQFADVDDAEIAAAQAADPDPDAWVRALAVRAARPTAEDKDQTWRAVVVDHTVPIGSIGTVAQAFWRPSQDTVLRPYPRRFLDTLPELGRRGTLVDEVITGRMFPVTAFDDDFPDQVAALLASTSITPSVANRATERADEVRRMISARRESAR